MAIRILWSQDARDDLIEIVSYIKAKSGSRIARTIYNRIKDQIDKIMTFPEGGRVVPELAQIGVMEIKELIESPWRVFYKVDESGIRIISIIDGRRNIEEILYRKMLEGKLK